MAMCEPQSNGGDPSPDHESMLFAVDSPASRSPSPVPSSEWVMSVGDGLGSRPWFARYDPGTCSWRTSQLSLATAPPSAGCSVIFPPSGSMRTGRCYRRAPWVRHIDGPACSSWLTPKARDYKGYTRDTGDFGTICN